MATEKEEVIFSVKIDFAESEKGIQDLKKRLDDLKQSNVENTTAIKNTEQAIKKNTEVIKAEDGSIKSLQESSKRLREERNRISLATEEGRKRVEALNKQIQENDKIIKENSTNLEKQRLNVGNYTDSIKDAANEINVAGVNVGGLSEKLTAGLTPLTAAAAGVSALAGLYLSSAAGAKDLESAQNQLNTSFTVISNNLAKLVGADGKGGGLLSAFAFQLNQAVFGTEASVTGLVAANAQRALQELELLELTSQRLAKEQLDLSEQARRVRDDETKSFQERLEAAQSVGTFINARELELIGTQERKLEQLNTLLRLDENNLDLQKQIKQVEFEISDIQEDSQGKRTEALNGINALLKEQRQAAIDANAEVTKLIEQQAINFKTVSDEEFAKSVENSFKLTELKQNEANFIVDTTNATISEEERLKDEAALKDNDRINNSIKNDKTAADQRLSTARALYNGLTASLEAFGIKSKGINAALAVANTFLGVTEILKAPASPFVEPFASIVRATQIATTIATGLSAVTNINKAAGGGDFITKGPTMLLVGDNPGGVERVTVEPLSGKGQTKVVPGGNLVAMAGGGTLTTGVTGAFETSQAASFAENQRLTRSLITAFQEMKPVLVLQDFEEVQNTRNQIQTTAQVL